jgi:hypothetical protein
VKLAHFKPIDQRVKHVYGVADLLSLTLSDSTDKPAGWGHLITTGHYVNPIYGEFDVTLADLDTAVHNFNNVTPQHHELPVDYSHTSRTPQTIDQAKAAGWMKQVEVRARDEARGYGELWCFTEYTPTCAKMIRDKELRYYSAEFRPHFIHKNTGEDVGFALVSAAVTIRPFVEGLNAITLTDAAPEAGSEVPHLRGALRLGDPSQALNPDDSIGDITEDLTRQIYERFGYGCWIKHIFMPDDGGCVVLERGGDLYRVEWTDNAGEPQIGDVLTPVRIAILPDTDAPALSEDASMKKHTIKLEDGRVVQVDESAIIALADTTGAASTGGTGSQSRPAATRGADPNVIALSDTVAGLVGAVNKLVERDVTRDKSTREADARRQVADLVKARKLLQKQAPWAINYALSDPQGFASYVETLVPLFSPEARGTGEESQRGTSTHTRRQQISGESITATDGDPTQTGAEQEFERRLQAYATDHKLDLAKGDDYKRAVRAVALADPALEHERREEMENTVIPFQADALNRHAETRRDSRRTA